MRFSNADDSGPWDVKMVQKFGLMVLSAGMLAAAHGEDAKVEYKPLNFGGFSEFGLLRSGQYGTDPFKNEWIDHFGAYIVQTAVADENLAFDVGIGGVFEYQKNEVVAAQWGGTQYKNFFIGPAVADIRYAGASRDGQGFGLQFGMFNYKYNPDASNLGEYLFRSGTYPGYVSSGGFWFVNNNAVQLQALRLGYGSGPLSADFFLITETSMPALYDLSAAAVVGYKVADGLLDFGAGLKYQRMIPVKPSRTSPRKNSNAYFTKNNKDWAAKEDQYSQVRDFHKAKGDTAAAHEAIARQLAVDDAPNAARHLAQASADSAVAIGYYSQFHADSATADLVKAWLANPKDSGISLKYYTQSGVIGMLRASLDLKKLFASDAFGPNDMRLYAELAILGIQNYPVYYTKITDRMPIMFGFNVPTFGLLDILSVQGEYYKSPYLNSYVDLVASNSATPTSVTATDAVRSGSEYADITKKDDLSWSLFAKRTFGGSAFVIAQVARDHIRTVSIKTWTAPEPTQVLGRPSDWYWMLQFGFGI